MTSACHWMIRGPSLCLFSLVLVWRALDFWRAFLASCWFFIIGEAMSFAEGTAVGRSLTLKGDLSFCQRQIQRVTGW